MARLLLFIRRVKGSNRCEDVFICRFILYPELHDEFVSVNDYCNASAKKMPDLPFSAVICHKCVTFCHIYIFFVGSGSFSDGNCTFPDRWNGLAGIWERGHTNTGRGLSAVSFFDLFYRWFYRGAAGFSNADTGK